VKAYRARLAVLVGKLQTETNPDERREVISEVMCPP
jgi:hypothetical protein